MHDTGADFRAVLFADDDSDGTYKGQSEYKIVRRIREREVLQEARDEINRFTGYRPELEV
jgi:hypothetical protein